MPHSGHRPGAVRPAHRRERQHQPDRVDDRLLEVDGVVRPTCPTSSASVVASVVAVGIGEQLGEVDLDVAGDRRQAACALARVGADTVPVTSTPSDTDSSRRSSSSGAPSSMRDEVQPDARRAGTVSAMVIIEPGRRPSREMSMTSGDASAAARAPTSHGVAITIVDPARVATLLRVRSPVRGSALRVVVRARRGAQLVTAATDRAQRAVEVVLELRELAVDVDVALAAQSVGLGVGRSR